MYYYICELQGVHCLFFAVQASVGVKKKIIHNNLKWAPEVAFPTSVIFKKVGHLVMGKHQLLKWSNKLRFSCTCEYLGVGSFFANPSEISNSTPRDTVSGKTCELGTPCILFHASYCIFIVLVRVSIAWNFVCCSCTWISIPWKIIIIIMSRSSMCVFVCECARL